MSNNELHALLIKTHGSVSYCITYIYGRHCGCRIYSRGVWIATQLPIKR